jgi:hypothetical protein
MLVPRNQQASRIEIYNIVERGPPLLIPIMRTTHASGHNKAAPDLLPRSHKKAMVYATQHCPYRNSNSTVGVRTLWNWGGGVAESHGVIDYGHIG